MKKEILKAIGKAVIGGVITSAGTIIMNLGSKECVKVVMEAAKKIADK